jgi:hypothetical protein
MLMHMVNLNQFEILKDLQQYLAFVLLVGFDQDEVVLHLNDVVEHLKLELVILILQKQRVVDQ